MLCKGIIIIINLHKYLAVIAPLFMTDKKKKRKCQNFSSLALYSPYKIIIIVIIFSACVVKQCIRAVFAI